MTAFAPICAACWAMRRKRVSASFFAEVGEQCDITANQRLQAGPECTEHRSGANDNAPNDPEISYYVKAVEMERGRNHSGIERRTTRLFAHYPRSPANTPRMYAKLFCMPGKGLSASISYSSIT